MIMRTRSKALDALRDYVAKTTAKSSGGADDPTYWRPTKDKVGNSKNELRFLPPIQGEAFPFVVFQKHAFQGNTPDRKWFIDFCPSTLHTGGYPSDHCPVCALANNLYRSSNPGDKELAQKMFRGKTWTANVLIVDDWAVPQNNGGVFKYQFGKKQFEMITRCISPEDGSTPFDPFDTEEGANFKLVVKRVAGFPNYDSSGFMKQSRIGTEDEIAAIMAKVHPLEPILDPSKFKSTDALKERLSGVMAPGTCNPITLVSKPPTKAAATARIDQVEPATFARTKSAKPIPGDEFDICSDEEYFQKLANGSAADN